MKIQTCLWISPKFVSLRPENNSFLNVRNRFCFNRGKSLKQSEEIGEIAFWQKIRKIGQAHFKTVFENTTKYSKLHMCRYSELSFFS